MPTFFSRPARFKRPRLLIIGCGDVGTRVAKLLHKKVTVYALTHSAEKIPALRQAGVVPLLADLDTPHTLWRLQNLAPRALHLAPPRNAGAQDIRTRTLLPRLAIAQLVYVSTSGVYGDAAGGMINETHTPKPSNARGVRRVDAEKAVRQWARSSQNSWQSSAQNSHAKNTQILRVPGIYAAERLPLERLHKGLPALRADEDSYTNHIHADDLARACVAALWRGAPQRLYNVCDNSAIKAGDWFDALADAHNLPRPPRVSRLEAEKILSPMQWSFLQDSRQLSNTRLLAELGLKLRYPTVHDFLSANVA